MSSIASSRRLSRVLVFALLLALVIIAPAAGQEPERIVRQLSFEGNSAVPDQVLTTAIATTNSNWFARVAPFKWAGLGEKRYFTEDVFRQDLVRLVVLYRKLGYPDVQVDTTLRRTPGSVYITVRINEGRPIRVVSFNITGIDSLPGWLRRIVLRDLPLQQGDVFNRFFMLDSRDTIAARLQDRGYPEAAVFPSFQSNRTDYTAKVTLDVVPGQRAVIDSVDVVGTNRVDAGLVRQLLLAQPGRRYSASEIFESQRSLYRSDLFRYASISIDSAHYRAGSDSVPLRVAVTENRPRRVTGSVGFATNDCFRGSLGWTKRNFLGGGRILDLSGRLSKVGAAPPLDWGVTDGICANVKEDTIGSSALNFGLTAAVRRPGFMSPYNTLSVSVYTERRSEFKVYLRRETGVSVNFTREAARRRLPVSLGYTLSYGYTNATAASFCAFFNACTPDVLEPLQQNRVLALLSTTVAMPRTNNPVNPTRGSIKSLELTVSSKYIGSSELQQFTRVVADAAWYRQLERGVVFAWRIRGGVIVAPTLDVASQSGAFIPPEQRFYAGGPNDVRGFQRNELGPVVYVVSDSFAQKVIIPGLDINPDSVRVAATGGNMLGVANAELRFPSPVFGSRVRLAAFVDAGAAWQRDAVPSARHLRVTPGFGVRVETPLGPARLDVAYNPYNLQPGELFQSNETTGALTPVPGQGSFVLDRQRHFTIHLAVGQPF